jgi:hypothetical protein
MNESEAKLILVQELSSYRNRSYDELLSLIDSSETVERKSESGTIYQIEMQVVFDDIKAQRNLRVLASIDDGSWHSFKPLCDGFIMAPDGLLVGE